MFEKLRRPGRSQKDRKIKKWLSFFVFGLICLVFVFLAPIGSNLIGEGVLGYVGREPIRAGELSFLEDNIKWRFKSRLEQADSEGYSKIQKEIRRIAQAEIVKLYLLAQSSQNNGFFLSDGELRSEIQSYPVFQKDGRFLYSRYQGFLKNQNLSPARFEERIRRGKLAENWAAVFQKAAPSNKLEEEKSSQRQRYKVNFRYAELSAEDIDTELLAALAKAKDLKAINHFLRANNAKWEETGLFSLFAAFDVPAAQNQALMDALMRRLPATGLIPRLIGQDGQVYIAQILAFKKERAGSQQKRAFFRQLDKSVRLLDSWLSFQSQKIKVKISDNI